MKFKKGISTVSFIVFNKNAKKNLILTERRLGVSCFSSIMKSETNSRDEVMLSVKRANFTTVPEYILNILL